METWLETTVFIFNVAGPNINIDGANVCKTEETEQNFCYDDYNNLLQTGYIIYLQVFDMKQNSDKSELER